MDVILDTKSLEKYVLVACKMHKDKPDSTWIVAHIPCSNLLPAHADGLAGIA